MWKQQQKKRETTEASSEVRGDIETQLLWELATDGPHIHASPVAPFTKLNVWKANTNQPFFRL